MYNHMVMCTRHLVHECGFPSWCSPPGRIAHVLALYMTCTHPASCNFLLVQKVHWAHTGTQKHGSKHVAHLQCHPCSWSATAYAVTWGGDPISPRRRSGWWWDDFWHCCIEVGLLLCYCFSFPRYLSPPSQNVMLYSSDQTDSFSQKSLYNFLNIV